MAELPHFHSWLDALTKLGGFHSQLHERLTKVVHNALFVQCII